MKPFIIETKAISKIFNQGKANEVAAVRSVSLAIPYNCCTVIKGPSGSGKSTLLAILGCLAKPTSGEYICLQQKVSRWSEKFLTSFRRQHLGLIFQNFNLIQDLTVEQNIALPLLPGEWSFLDIKKRVAQVCELVQIGHRLKFKVETLSGGEMQRVAMARALINDPEIIIADEPTAHLDTELSKTILNLLAHLKNSGKTLLVSTHDLLVENHPMVDKILCIRDGHLGDSDVC